METWPSPLPRAQGTLVVESTANTFRSKLDSGLLEQRMRWPGLFTTVDISWDLDDLQFGQLLSFHKYNINLGSDWFLMSLNVDGTDRDLVVRFFQGQISNDYTETSRWIVSAKLELKVRPVMSEADLDDALEMLGALHDSDGNPIVDNDSNPIVYRVA